MAKITARSNDTSANLGFEVFPKYISDAFEAKHAELEAQKAEGTDPEDRDESRAASIFWVPREARWQHLKASAPQPTIGNLVDDALAAIERDNPSLKGVLHNPSLKGVLPKDYARPGLDKQRLGQIINLVSDISFHPSPPGEGPGVRERPVERSPASARPRRLRTSASTAMSSRPAVTSAPRLPRTTASRSRRR